MLTTACAPGLARTSTRIMQSTDTTHAMSIAELPLYAVAVVTELRSPSPESDASFLQRLVEVGFVPGEKLKVVAFGHPGREPIAVRIGGTTFALRRFEAQCVLVTLVKAKA